MSHDDDRSRYRWEPFVTERENAVALYTFLKEFAQLRTRTIRDIDSYEQVIWTADVPREDGCDCIAWHRDADGASDEIWLEIRKPRLTRPPEPPESVSAWVRRDQLADSSLDIPELYTTSPGESVDDLPLRLEDHPEVEDAWDTYVEDHWWTWAERDRREQEVQTIYTDLFAMYQRQQRLGENFEIVFGLGFLTWNSPDGHEVRRHLTVARVSIEFDAEDGTLTVTPAGEGARPSLEQDMLDPQYGPDPQELDSIEKELEKIGESVWAAGPLDGLLKSWAHSVDARGEYSNALQPPTVTRVDQTPMVHLAPALILRRRTERSYIRAFEDIIAQLDADEPVPEGVSRFIGVSKDQTIGDATSKRGRSAPPDEIYFPLPANDAQRQIVERLATNQGVLVQGPPGTGKSHTIVNLICHALASGQRILVTSHAARSLKVLQGMIREKAPDLAPLAVVLLGDDRDALLAMEESVQGITTRHNAWTPMESQLTIADLETDLDKGRRREAKILADLREIREQETLRHDAKFGYGGSPAQIADTLRGEREALDWIPDETLHDVELLGEFDDARVDFVTLPRTLADAPEGIDPPLPAAQFRDLVSLLRDARVGERESCGWDSLNEDGLPIVDIAKLPPVEAFERAVQREREARRAYEGDESIRQRSEYDALGRLPDQDRAKFADGLRELDQAVERIERRPLSWAGPATKQILDGAERTWPQLHEDTLAAIRSINESAKWLDANPISPEPSSDLPTLRADAKDLHDHLITGGGWGIGPLRAKVVKRAGYIRELRIGGRPCEHADAVSDLLRRLDSELESRRLRERWALYHESTAATFTDLVAELEDLCKPLEEAFKAQAISRELSAILRRTRRIPEPDWSDRASLRRLSETLDAVNSARRYEGIRNAIDRKAEDITQQLSATRLAVGQAADPAAEDLKDAVAARDAAAYSAALQRAAGNIETELLLRRKWKLAAVLRDAAPMLADALAQTPDNNVWDERAADFERAWNWRRAYAWVTRLAAPDSEQQLRNELKRTKQDISRTLEQLAAEKAWAHCIDRMTEPERQHLIAWQQAIRRIGKGTGKYASQHRRDAREHLNECRSAIPAWVMPLHRVAETIKPGSELFDIAIIDEASQSGPEALLLAWLAKKIVVVGDDKQIHPTYAGINFEDVNQLRYRHIRDIPHADAFGAQGGSFFDLAGIFFPDSIRLREHFRCMPEIIQFSNNLSYRDGPLIPLRQYGAGRLEPTVVTRHVPDGYQQGTASRAVNPPEAKAMVEEIARICRDPTYDGKTIGVINLLGDDQARMVEAGLISEIGPEEMERRQLVCGDAYAFQGDERDVMFLSMVSAPRDDRRIPALVDQTAQQRFNVAASRARDQVFLFHTATLDSLSEARDCVRRQLLEYYLDPKVAMTDVLGLDAAELERIALQTTREHGNQPHPFDSWFELDVLLPIARRGYRVIPQFETYGYRIDLVVEGMDGRLAVECDGDEWHGADRYEADAARQRDLERCGWVFWRVRECVFRLDPDKALDDLWETLKRHRVFPKTEDEMRRKVATQALEKSSTARDSIDALAVENDQTFHVEGATSDIPSGRGLAEAAVTTSAEQLPAYAQTRGHASTDGGGAILEVRSDYATGKTRDSRPTKEWPETVPQFASPLSTSDPLSDDGRGEPSPGHHSEPTPTGTGKNDWLAPYAEWTTADTVPDPRYASQAELVSLLTDVLGKEGPIVAIRAYRLINRASGSRRLTGPARRALNLASSATIRAGVVVAKNPLNLRGQAQLVLRMPGTPDVNVRERGPRELDELPSDEVAMMLRSLRERDRGLDQEQLKRQLLTVLGWVRLTPKVNEFLNRCVTLI